MSDDSFIREVDDELRQDRAKAIWDGYGRYIIGAAILVVAATAAWRGWEYYVQQQAAASGDRFMEAIRLSGEGKNDAAIEELERLVQDGSGQYPALAKMRIASELAVRGETQKAIESYDAIAADSTFAESFRNVSSLRAGLLAVDALPLEETVKRLEPLAGAGLAYRHSAREGLGLAYYKAGKLQEAAKWFDAIANDAQTGINLRGRANIMLDLLAGKGITSKSN